MHFASGVPGSLCNGLDIIDTTLGCIFQRPFVKVADEVLRFGSAAASARLTFVASQPAISNLPGGFAPAAAAAFAFAFGAADFPFPAAFPFPFPPAAFPFPSAFAFAVFPPAAAGFFDSADAVFFSSSSAFCFLIFFSFFFSYQPIVSPS